MQGNRRAGVPFLLLLLLLVDLLLVAAPAAAVDKYSGRVVISYIAGSTRGGASAHHAVTALMRRRLEDEVAPELISSRWPAGLGVGNSGEISYRAINKNEPACPREGCPAKGESYTRPCTYKDRCPSQ